MTPTKPMGKVEFIVLMGVIFASTAFSIDAMLPALPEIGAELSPTDPNRAQLILTAFVLGMGAGTFFTGPLSDTFGRRPVMFAGAALYLLGAFIAWASTTLEVVLAARLLQGLGVAGPRIVSVAVMRDLYSGRTMARMMSIAMVIFTIFPAIAPAIGAGIIAFVGWRGIFLAFMLFMAIAMAWMGLRLPETLPVENRRPFRGPALWGAVVEMFTHAAVRLSILVQTLCFAMLFCVLVMVQPIYDITFGRADSFPFWFGGVALVAGSAGFLNAALVMRLGMRRLVTVTLAVQICISAVMLTISFVTLPQTTAFAFFVFWQTTLFFMAGMTIGNLNAIAMEPMGHIAGMAASVIGGVATVLSAAIAAPIGLLFDGTTRPLALAVLVMASIGFVLMLRMGVLERRAERTVALS